MKICVTAQGNNDGSAVDPRFGRCRYFIIADTDSGQTEVLDNQNRDGMGGVGIQAGQAMAEKGVKAVLTGNVGPNAFQTLTAAGIEVITGVSGSVREAIDDFKRGKLSGTKAPSVDSHFGMK
ncbi:MAG: NifB/NifX family molybdenum-iron cluster-binding protein [Candidatus Omnitrophica bacterium]|nr:NifB/NifX family molybdenum-iron cluster-binding protein [Candidatus Omnitrophota bacterium]